MNLLLALLAGAVIGLFEAWLRARFGAAPDLAAVALVLMLIGSGSRWRHRRNGWRCLGLMLGFSTCSLDPPLALVLGGGIAGVLLQSLRSVVFVERAATQAVFGLIASLALVAGRELYAFVGLAPKLALAPASWTTPLLTALAVPILARVGLALRRMARWNAGRDGADVAEAPPPG